MIKMVRIVSGLDQSPSNQKQKKVKLLDWLLTRHSSTHEHSKWRCMLGPFFFLPSIDKSFESIYLSKRKRKKKSWAALWWCCLMPAMSPAPSFLRDWRSTTEYKRTKKKEIKRRRERERRGWLRMCGAGTPPGVGRFEINADTHRPEYI